MGWDILTVGCALQDRFGIESRETKVSQMTDLDFHDLHAKLFFALWGIDFDLALVAADGEAGSLSKLERLFVEDALLLSTARIYLSIDKRLPWGMLVSR